MKKFILSTVAVAALSTSAAFAMPGNGIDRDGDTFNAEYVVSSGAGPTIRLEQPISYAEAINFANSGSGTVSKNIAGDGLYDVMDASGIVGTHFLRVTNFQSNPADMETREFSEWQPSGLTTPDGRATIYRERFIRINGQPDSGAARLVQSHPTTIGLFDMRYRIAHPSSSTLFVEYERRAVDNNDMRVEDARMIRDTNNNALVEFEVYDNVDGLFDTDIEFQGSLARYSENFNGDLEGLSPGYYKARALEGEVLSSEQAQRYYKILSVNSNWDNSEERSLVQDWTTDNPSSKAKYIQQTKTFERQELNSATGEYRGTGEMITETRTILNPGWKAAQLKLENQVKSDLENGRKLTATTKHGVDIVVNIDAGAVSLSKDITKTYSTKTHDLSAYVAPRAGLLGIGKSEYTLGTFAGVEAGASVKAKDGSTKVTVGYDSGNHFRTTGVKDGYRGLRSSAQTDDALFIETESVVKATGSIIGVRVDSEDRVSGYIENDAGARIGAEVNDDGALRLTAGYTVKF